MLPCGAHTVRAPPVRDGRRRHGGDRQPARGMHTQGTAVLRAALRAACCAHRRDCQQAGLHGLVHLGAPRHQDLWPPRRRRHCDHQPVLCMQRQQCGAVRQGGWRWRQCGGTGGACSGARGDGGGTALPHLRLQMSYTCHPQRVAVQHTTQALVNGAAGAAVSHRIRPRIHTLCAFARTLYPRPPLQVPRCRAHCTAGTAMLPGAAEDVRPSPAAPRPPMPCPTTI